jgi:hypothetical protein
MKHRRWKRLLYRNNPAPLTIGLGVGLLAGLGLLAAAYRAYKGTPLLGGPNPSAMLSIAGSYLGVKEDPPKSNRGPVVDLFNQGTGQKWCGWFVSYVLRKAGIATKDWPSVKDLHARALALNALSTQPSVGAVFLHVTGTGVTGYGYDHTGFVASVNPDGSWRSIEGNASDKVEAETHPNNYTGETNSSFVFIPFAALSQVYAP